MCQQNRQEPENENQNHNTQQQSKTFPAQKQNTEDQKKHVPPTMDINRNFLKKAQNESKGLIRRTSSSIDEKQRKEAQTPTLTAQKNPIIPPKPASAVSNIMPEIKLNLNAPTHVPATVKPNTQPSQIQPPQNSIKPCLGLAAAPASANTNTNTSCAAGSLIKPSLNLIKATQNTQLQQNSPQNSQNAQKIQQPKQVNSFLPQSNLITPKVITQPNNPTNQIMPKNISPNKNPLLMGSQNLFSNIKNVNQQQPKQQLPVIEVVENKQVESLPKQSSNNTQTSVSKSELSGKRSSSSLNNESDNEIKDTTEKKIKPNSEDRNQLEYQNLKKNIRKEMEIEDGSHDDSSSSVCSHDTVVLQDANNQKNKSLPTSQQQQQEEISRKGSDISDDSKSLSLPSVYSSNKQEDIQLSLQKQRKRSEQIELNNKIRQNLEFIDTKKDKILQISKLIQEQLSPEMINILKQQVKIQRELLFPSSGTSSKKQSKINSKLLDSIVSKNVQLLQELKI